MTKEGCCGTLADRDLATAYNAVRLLTSYGSPEQSARIPVCRGTEFPLIQRLREASSIHGEDGLGGVQGLLDMR